MSYSKEHKNTHSSQKIYYYVFLALLFLTFVTVFISRFHFSTPMAIGLALAVASVKGSLVAYFFMHLGQEKPWIYTILIFALFAFLAIIILIVLSHTSRLEHYYVP